MRAVPSEMTVNLTPGSEREALVNLLEAQRTGLMRKVEDVPDASARLTPTASSLSLLGLLKHATTWEHRWFEVIVAGRESPERWPEVRPDPRDAELVVHDDDTVADWLTRYRAQAATSDEIVAANDLDVRGARPDIVACNLRYVLLHMIQETARHAGHADIIRETLDGSRGI